MNNKERRLGKGLAALLGNPAESGPAGVSNGSLKGKQAKVSPQHLPSAEAGEDTVASREIQLNVYEIDENPFQPRRDFSEPEIVSLAESLKEHDMLQPVLVRRIGKRFQLISGERRLRAAIKAGWSQIPARVREADDRLVAELAIVENLQRKDLNPLEKALSFRRYLEEHHCPQDELATRLKIDRSTIANLLRLLELPEVVQEALRSRKLTAGHARALLPLGDEKLQVEFCQTIRSEGLSVRETERRVTDCISQEDDPQIAIAGSTVEHRVRTRNEQVAALEQELRLALGTKVEIKQSARGKGRIVIHFSGHEEFERMRGVLAESGSIPVDRNVG